MSSEHPSISLRGLGKCYPLTTVREQPYSFTEMLITKVRRPFHRPSSEQFWALRDFSAEIHQGETVGVIGRNGAGKSTLLKILSKITDPSEGEVALYGRVGSLLEVGTGFHPELTGRENIFLNGAILGMRRSDIARQFDAIVDFAAIEKFLDTPVKKYSSGMYVRLAFAVAAHLEPEILLVDEVLAVGDLEFQQKCIGKMRDEAASGRTVLFVSHSMAAVQNLCKTCLVLEQGRLLFAGETADAIQYYLDLYRQSGQGAGASDYFADQSPMVRPHFSRVRLLNKQGESQGYFSQNEPFVIEMAFQSPPPGIHRAVIEVTLNHLIHGAVGAVTTQMTNFTLSNSPHTSAVIRCYLKSLPLLQGMYSLDVRLSDGPLEIEALPGCISFSIDESDVYGTGRAPSADKGVIYLEPTWEMIPVPETSSSAKKIG